MKDKNQLQEQLIYLGSGFIESYKCYTLSTSIREIHPVSHVSRAKATCHVQAAWYCSNKQHLPINYCVSFVRALAKLIVLVKTLGVIGSPIIDQVMGPGVERSSTHRFLRLILCVKDHVGLLAITYRS